MVKKVSGFVLGLFIMAFGVALSVRADLGVSPISCAPYVYSLMLSLTLGELTILLNALLIVMQVIILRRKYRLVQMLQIPAVVIFGYFIDLATNMLSGLNVSSYVWQVFWCLISCAVLALGVFIIIKANLTYLPGEGLAVAIADTFQKEFGKVKIGIDSSMVIIGTASSFIFIYRLQGIREGTIISALTVGYLVRFFSTILPATGIWLQRFLSPENCSEKQIKTTKIT